MNKNRLFYIDNLRLFIIVLVVIQHIAMSYSGIGDWYFKDPVEIGFIQVVFFLYYLSFTQGYFMGIMFLIAGYFTPVSYDKKGFSKFLKERLIRLGIPTLIHMLILHPILMLMVWTALGIKDMNFFIYFLKNIFYFKFISFSGPLWFTFALLVFSALYALVRKFIVIKPSVNESDFPANSKIFMLILVISLSSFLVRIVLPIGTKIINMRLCYFSQYIILFIAGIKCRRNNWFEKLNYSAGKRWFISALTIGPISWMLIMQLGGALYNDYEIFNGGITWQSAAFSIWESFVAISMSIGLIAVFREKFNKQNKLVKIMTDNAFSVYVFHTPVMTALSILFSNAAIIPIVKFVLLLFITVPLCFIFTHFTVRKIPILKKLLV